MKVTFKAISQILVWIGVFIFFFSISNYFNEWKTATLLSAFNTIMVIGVFKLTQHLLFPKYYVTEKNYWFIAISAVLIYSIVYFFLDNYILSQLRIIKGDPPPVFFIFLRVFSWSFFSFFIGTSVKLNEHNRALLKREAQLQKEKLQTELQLLRTQINPHFLFNALNNIYSLSYMKSDAAPESILKLSGMLRYVIEDCVTEEVPLASEVAYIGNYVSFQKMKFPEEREIEMHFDISDRVINVAPMLFIPFIENSFKYSRIEDFENSYIKISVTADNEKVLFSIINSIPPTGKVKQGAGTGIANVKNRLGIIYPDKYTLKIKEQEDSFLINLEIKL